VAAAYERLRAAVPEGDGRRFFGISHPNEKGEIIYKAAAEERHAGEAEALGLDTFVIRKGDYVSEVLPNWMECMGEMKALFQKLLAQPGIAPDGYCLEDYFNETDVRLMVTLA
jgi:hypothetical protein